MGKLYKILLLFACVFVSQFVVAQTIDSLNTDLNQTINDSITQTSNADSAKIENNIPVSETTKIESTNTTENNDELNSQNSNTLQPDSATTQEPLIENPQASEKTNEDLFNAFAISPPAFSDTVIVNFVKENVTQSPDSLYFNVLKITNYKQNSVRGELMFTAPDGWNIISASGNVINLASGDSAYIPVRLAIDNETAGALSYILNATFKIENEIFTTNTYITIPAKRFWTMKVDKSIVVFNQYDEVEEIKIKLSNKGNTAETIKLEYKIGELLKVDGIDEFNNILYVNLPSNKDSIVRIRVKSNKSISFEDQVSLSRNWKEASIEIKSNTFDKNQKHIIWFKKLYSVYIGSKLNASSPLNIGLTLSNLLSGQSLKLNSNIFGTILFSKERNLSYAVNLISFGFQKNEFKNYDFRRKVNFIVNFQQKKLSITAGSNISGGGGGVGFSGLGIKVDYRFDNKSKLSFGVMNSRNYSDAFGSFVQFHKKILGVGLRTGISFANFPSFNKQYVSGLIGASFSLLRFNTFNIDIYRSTSDVSKFFINDSTLSGFGYNLGYGFVYKKFTLSASLRTYLKYDQKIGQDLNVKSTYKLKNGVKINANYDRRKSFIDISKYNLAKNSIFNSYDMGRFLFMIPTKNNVSFSIGPAYNSFVQQSIDRQKRYISKTSSYNPKLNITLNRRISKRTSLSGFFQFGLSYINYTTEDTLINPLTINNKGTYSFGTSYNSKYWKLNVTYNIGSMTDMWSYLNYHMMYPFVSVPNIMTQSIIFRPIFEKSFLKNKIRTQLMGNYTFYMPSERESIVLTSNNYFDLNRGWFFSLNANMYMGSVKQNEINRTSSKSVNIQLGLRKSFDIQQPRLKHYDLTLVCFNDLNGNKIKDENEPPMPNIQVSYERTSRTDDPNLASQLKTNFALI